MNASAIVDTGSCSTKVLVGKIVGGNLVLTGVGKAKSEGVKEGRIVNSKKAGDSTGKAVKRAKERASSAVETIQFGAGGPLLDFSTTQATVSLASGSGVVTEEDLERLRDLARSNATGVEGEIISEVPDEFVLDGQGGVTNPLGLEGRRLDTSITLVTVKPKDFETFKRTSGQSGLAFAGLLPTPVSLGNYFLNEDERARGRVILDYGHETTEISVFRRGKFADHETIEMGGQDLTNDLAAVFDLEGKEARELKREVDLSERAETEEKLSVKGEKSKQQISSPVKARLEETFQLVISEIDKLGHGDLQDYGIKITGGSAQITGLTDFLSERFGAPFELARPEVSTRGLKDVVKNPSYGPALALLNWELNERTQGGMGEDVRGGEKKYSISGLAKGLTDILKRFFSKKD
jgi:cell division protein FtsA